VKSAVFVAGGARIATATDQQLQLWDLQHPEKPATTVETIFHGALSNDRTMLIANEDGEQLQIVDARTGTVTSGRPAEDLGVIEKHAISPDRKAIAVATSRNRVFVLDANTRQITFAADLPRGSDFEGMELTADGALLVVGRSADNSYEIVVRDLASN